MLLATLARSAAATRPTAAAHLFRSGASPRAGPLAARPLSAALRFARATAPRASPSSLRQFASAGCGCASDDGSPDAVPRRFSSSGPAARASAGGCSPEAALCLAIPRRLLTGTEGGGDASSCVGGGLARFESLARTAPEPARPAPCGAASGASLLANQRRFASPRWRWSSLFVAACPSLVVTIRRRLQVARPTRVRNGERSSPPAAAHRLPPGAPCRDTEFADRLV